MITLSHVYKTFDQGRSYAVEDLSFVVEEGETLVLLGSSGCGKTTTLKMVNRLVEPSKGIVKVGGRDVMAQDPVTLRLSIGYVFQGIGLFPHMTIWENVGLTLRLLKWPKSRQHDRVEELLHLVGLPPEDYADRFPDELSGGQQQRVGVARALAADPKYLLMDEPFGALDSLTRKTLQRELLEIKSRLNKTIIFVTHDVTEALLLADRVGIIHNGRLEQLGAGSDVVKRPATPFVRELLSGSDGRIESR